MRINKIIVLLIFMLSNFYSCSAQKELQQERCNVLNDIMPATYKTRIMNWILSISDIREKRPHFNSMQYFKLDSLNYIYVNEPMYQLRMKDEVDELYSLLTKEDLENMKKQYKESGKNKHFVSEDCFESSDVFFKKSKKVEGNTVSLPLFSIDKQKCMFFYFNDILRQSHPNICICKKENGKWKLVAQISGSLYEVYPPSYYEIKDK